MSVNHSKTTIHRISNSMAGSCKRAIVWRSLFVFSLMLYSCSFAGERQIQEKWQNQQAGFLVEFADKNIFIISAGGAGKWFLIDASRLKIEFPNLSLVCDYILTGYTLTIDSKTSALCFGYAGTYRRVKSFLALVRNSVRSRHPRQWRFRS